MDRRDMLYKCLECGEQEIVKASDHRKDGRTCRKCRGHLSPVYYIGIDLAKGNDKFTTYRPPGQKNEKTLRSGRTGKR